VKSHSVLGCISLYKGFLLNLGNESSRYADRGDRRQEQRVRGGCYLRLICGAIRKAEKALHPKINCPIVAPGGTHDP
jgi:hypothetical protein